MLLVLLDHKGPVLFFGAEAVPTSEAGLVLAADLAAGRATDLGALAARHAVDLDPLAQLQVRLAAWFSAAEPTVEADTDRHVAYLPTAPVGYAPDALLQCPLPLPTILTAAGFQVWAPSSVGAIALDAHEAALLGCFTLPRRAESVTEERLPGNPLVADPAARDALLSRLVEVGLLSDRFSFAPRGPTVLGDNHNNAMRGRNRDRIRRQSEVLAARPPRNGRVPVFGVESAPTSMPSLALGLLFTASEAFEGGRLVDTYDFVPDWAIRLKSVRKLVSGGPGVFLFADYLWTVQANLAISARVKELSPHSVVVHGGPDAPKYEGDRERFFDENPSVDVLVHGEGEGALPEVLAALDGRLDGDLRALAAVAGITYRPSPDAAPVSTEDRPRLVELDPIPSPYLSGTFDAWDSGGATMAVLETNRGCPYGCTFCDWGSATLSRIRKYDLQRVFDELEWMAKAKVEAVLLADANFGIFERDVAIAEHVVAMRQQYGYPRALFTNYAKNTVKHLEPIVRTLIAGGLHTHGIMSVQTFDEPTLKITKRKNLKTDDYARLGAAFVEAQLPIFSDLMLGLPGSTLASTADDLQRLIEQEITARTYATQLLTNSPMNEPSYRAEWQLVTDEHGLLRSTSSYTAEERDAMDRLVVSFHAADTYGILRTTLRWLSVELGQREIDVLEAIRVRAAVEPARLPLLAWTLGRFTSETIAPGTWRLLYDEVERVVEELWGLDLARSDWQAVRALQEHVLPDRGRRFPDAVRLPHDVVTWLRDVRERQVDDEPASRPQLSSYGPTTVSVNDPMGTCDQLGIWRAIEDTHTAELDWPMARNVSGRWDPEGEDP